MVRTIFTHWPVMGTDITRIQVFYAPKQGRWVLRGSCDFARAGDEYWHGDEKPTEQDIYDAIGKFVKVQYS